MIFPVLKQCKNKQLLIQNFDEIIRKLFDIERKFYFALFWQTFFKINYL